jgi:hypothetical protein
VSTPVTATESTSVGSPSRISKVTATSSGESWRSTSCACG